MSSRLYPSHEILPQAYLHEVIGFSYQQTNQAARDTWMDLTLRHKQTGDVRRLRFLRPREITIKAAFSSNGPGLFIDDIRKRQLDDLQVHFGNFENSEGGLDFYAAEVIDLDKLTANPSACAD